MNNDLFNIFYQSNNNILNNKISKHIFIYLPGRYSLKISFEAKLVVYL